MSSTKKQSSYTKLQMGLKLMDSKSKKTNARGKNFVMRKRPVTEKKTIIPPPLNPHEPDRSYSDYFCRICDSHMNSKNMWESHIRGKRHLKKISQDSSATSVNEQAKFKIKGKAWIENELREIKDPIVGLKYITELRKSDPNLGATYKCYLCSASLATPDILIDHLYTAKHKLAYIKETDSEGHKLIEGLGLKKSALENVADEHARDLEKKYGRGIVEVEIEKQVPTLKKWSDNRKKGPPSKKIRTDGWMVGKGIDGTQSATTTSRYSDDDSGHHESRSYRDFSPARSRKSYPSPSPPNERYSMNGMRQPNESFSSAKQTNEIYSSPRQLSNSYPSTRQPFETDAISPLNPRNDYYDRLPSLRENERQGSYLPQPYGPEEPSWPKQYGTSEYNYEQLSHNGRYDLKNSPPKEMDGPIKDDLYFSRDPIDVRVNNNPVQRLGDNELGLNCYEPPIHRMSEPTLKESVYRMTRPDENYPKSEVVHPPQSPPFAVSPNYQRANNEPVYPTQDPPSEKSTLTIADFVKVIQMSPSPLRLNIMENLIPLELTSEKDCKRLEQISNSIMTSVWKFKASFLGPEQQKQLKEVCGFRSDDLISPIIPGINDDSRTLSSGSPVGSSAYRDNSLSRRSFHEQAAAPPAPNHTTSAFMDMWHNATHKGNYF